MELLFAVVVTALVSIDPIGPALMFKGMSDGVPRANLIAFAVATCVAMVAAGMALAAVSMIVIDVISVSSPSANEAVGAALKIGLAVVLVGWLLYTGLSGAGAHGRSRADKADGGLLHGSVAKVGGAGAVFGLSALLNPVLWVLAATLAALESPMAVLAGLVLWVLIAECLLLGLLAAYLVGAHERLVRAVRDWQERHRTAIRVVLYTAAAVLAVVLAVDGIRYFAD